MRELPQWCPTRPCNFIDALRVIYEATLERYRHFFPDSSDDLLDSRIGMKFPSAPAGSATVKHYMIELVLAVLNLIKYSPDTRKFGTFADQMQPFYYRAESAAKELFSEYGFNYDIFDLTYNRLWKYRRRPRLVGDWEWVATMCEVLNNLCVFPALWWMSPRGNANLSNSVDGCYIHSHFVEKNFNDANNVLLDCSGVELTNVSSTIGGGHHIVANWDCYLNKEYEYVYRKVKKYDFFFKNYHAGQFIGNWQMRFTSPVVYQRTSPELKKFTFDDTYPDLTVNITDCESEKFNIPGDYSTLISQVNNLPNSTKNEYIERVVRWRYNKILFNINWENIPDLPYQYFDRQIFDHIYQQS